MYIYMYTRTCFLFITFYSLCHLSDSLRFHVGKLHLDTFPSAQESAAEVLYRHHLYVAIITDNVAKVCIWKVVRETQDQSLIFSKDNGQDSDA